MTNERIKETMAAIFTQEPAKQEPGPKDETIGREKPAAEPKKRRRRSLIDKDVLPEPIKEPRKRTRKKKDPALKKSYSMTVLMTEEMHQRLKNIAEQQELSMNGIVTRLIRKYIVTHDVDLTDL